MRAPRRDMGATLIMTAFALFALIGAAAIAVDLAALRADRSTDQKVTDSSASAGVLAVLEGGAGQEACEAALAYVAINSEEVASLSSSGCAVAFSAACDPLVAEEYAVTTGRFDVSVVYPVPNSHPLITSGVFGASQPLDPADGDPCERVAVQISAEREGLFSQLLGVDQGTTTVHTVAVGSTPSGEGVPINLLVLERTGCQTLLTTGNGGIVVNAVVNEDGDGLLQGVAASDSDGSAGCTNNGVIDVDGTNSLLRADGPEGCAGQVGTGSVGGFTSGHGCGSVQSIAPGAGSGCVAPACTSQSGNPSPIPDPTRMPGRLTRAPVDYRYNCYGNYAVLPGGVSWATAPLTAGNQQDIPGCTEDPPTPPHIYNLIAGVGPNGSSGFTDWSTLGHGCVINAPIPTITGNVRVDCASLRINGTVRIEGNVIFDGDVDIGSDGRLTIDNSGGPGDFAFFRDGELKKAGQASLSFQETAVYMSKTSVVNLTGGSGSLNWVAPIGGRFDDLALWSDSPLEHRWAGQANLNMEGVFFMPWARATYTGGGGQNQTNAQWIARALEAKGQGFLQIAPAFGRAVEFPVAPQTTLIR